MIMTKLKVEFSDMKKVTGRTSRTYPEAIQENEVVYGLEVELGNIIRVVKLDELDNQHPYLYFITKKSVRLPKDKEIYRFYLAFDDRMYVDSYDVYVFDKQTLGVTQVTLLEEGLCWFLMHDDTADDDYIDEYVLNEMIKEHFEFGEDVEFLEYFETEELVW